MINRMYTFTPVDVWFFRDGRPYNQGESSQTGVVSLFPPNPATVFGALRAGLARANGWDGHTAWSALPTMRNVLGDGADVFGTMQMRGPCLQRTQDGKPAELLWPLPAHVIGQRAAEGSKNSVSPGALLSPGATSIVTDRGDVRLPMPPAGWESTRPKGTEHLWITSAGLAAVLRGQVPEASTVVSAKALWAMEPRVGIERDRDRRTTGEGALYSPLMVRPRRGVGLAVEVAGVPDDWRDPPAYVPLGGESRLAQCQRAEASIACPPCPEEWIHKSRGVIVVHLSPAQLDVLPEPGEEFPGLHGLRVVSACTPPLVTIGGWDGAKQRPLALEPYIASGSVWFCELEDTHVLARHGGHIGSRCELGFGHIALGAWPEPSKGC